MSRPFILTKTLGTVRNNFTGCVGMSFTVGSQDIIITDLSRWKISGNSAAHTVRIMSGASTTMASVSIAMSGATDATDVYAAIPPIKCFAGVTYYQFSSETNLGDQFYDIDTRIDTADAAITVGNGWYENTCGVDINNAGLGTNLVYVPLNFKFHYVSEIQGALANQFNNSQMTGLQYSM